MVIRLEGAKVNVKMSKCITIPPRQQVPSWPTRNKKFESFCSNFFPTCFSSLMSKDLFPLKKGDQRWQRQDKTHSLLQENLICHWKRIQSPSLIFLLCFELKNTLIPKLSCFWEKNLRGCKTVKLWAVWIGYKDTWNIHCTNKGSKCSPFWEILTQREIILNR